MADTPLWQQRDPYGDRVLAWKWDWHDERIMAWINNFPKISKQDTYANVNRQNAKRTGKLMRSLAWKTWSASGGNSQVFEARYIYYAKYVELAVGGHDKFTQLPPGIARPQWLPITMPDRKRKAKPHVVTEMRKQALKFERMIRNEFSFVGTVFMVYAMGNNQSAAAAVNRALFWAAHNNKREK